METTVKGTSLLDSALNYATLQGWRVFPVGRDKRPLTAHGFQDATTHEGLIREWFTKWPDANVALDIPEDVVILDFDPRNGAPEPWVFQGFSDTLVAETPGGGYHVYFRLEAGTEVAGKWMPGIDVKRGGKGYVLLPWSRNEEGRAYSWYKGEDEAGFDLNECILPLPNWVFSAIRRQETATFDTSGGETQLNKPTFPWELGTQYGTYGLEQQLGHLAMATEGDRNNRLNKVGYRVGQLAAAGELKEAALYEVARVAEYIGLDKEEVFLTLKSAYEAGLRKPWSK